ncbi:dihydrodipicolinate synthase family protein [Fodinibius sediminis]|uniref:Dihydrodipicolinate synthase/N-acetylneuraminate lyase n=1 Tax=Fodinibius sediminis TaxID=1214077 RepID=A0A521CS68_9BACT|nr:dihydrodipicolinate synthase family protein [Fodinibius sediminis]SMO62329.1 Dihydrodipicolinate synthase/N-acetylneuraminate lyase [Fodinibius sediminis]
MIEKEVKEQLQNGTVIPAHPLALDAERNLDEQRQRLLSRYYMASGAGGIAVGVHSTQFEIRDEGIDLLEPVLRIAAEEVEQADLERPFIKVAGLVGPTEQAIEEAELAASLGYDLGLLSMGGLSDYSEMELIKRAEKVGQKIPLFGFYLQPAVGGQLLSFDFWRDFADIPAVHAIKMAPFNRYQTLDVVRAVCHSSRHDDIALYTGNDDNIIPDLLTTYRFNINGEERSKSIVGGLLGHWAVWTRKAVDLLKEIKELKERDSARIEELLTRGIEITDTNSVIFDAANNFHGCIPGIHEILRRQGLLEGRWCLNPEEMLSPGQEEEIDRIYESYPHLNDDDFVKNFLNSDPIAQQLRG